MPRAKEFTVTLTAGDRAKLTRVVSSGRHPARMITRARVLLALDEARRRRRIGGWWLNASVPRRARCNLVAKAFATQLGGSRRYRAQEAPRLRWSRR